MANSNFSQLVHEELQKGLVKAGFYLVSTVRQNINVAKPYLRGTGKSGVWFKGQNPSSPGQFPHKLSGQLIKSIASTVGDLTLTVGSAIPHAKFLQLGTKNMAPRPWLSLTWEREQSAVAKIILGV